MHTAFRAAMVSAIARTGPRVDAVRSMLGARGRAGPFHEHTCPLGNHRYAHVNGECPDRVSRRLCLYHAMNVRIGREYSIPLDSNGNQLFVVPDR